MIVTINNSNNIIANLSHKEPSSSNDNK